MEFFVGRRYGDFSKLHKKLRLELPGKVLPTMPRKNKQSSTASNLLSAVKGNKDDDDASSMSSVSTMGTMATDSSMKNLTIKDHRKSASALSLGRSSPRPSMDERPATGANTPAEGETVTLWRENQRISLRAFLRTLLSQPQIANTKAIQEFLTFEPMTPSDADVDDIFKRKAMDDKRVKEQKEFYEVARKRAAELDVYMEQYASMFLRTAQTNLVQVPS